MIYPNISKELKHENTVRLLEGNVVVKIDSRSGRLTASINNIIFCEKIHEEGMNVALVIPNSTDITQVMDNILQYFNTAFNQCTPQLCSKKIIIKSQKLWQSKGKTVHRVSVLSEDQSMYPVTKDSTKMW